MGFKFYKEPEWKIEATTWGIAIMVACAIVTFTLLVAEITSCGGG